MSIFKEPPRLSDPEAQVSPFLRDALIAARKKPVTDAQVKRIAERLSPMMQSKIPVSIATQINLTASSTGFSLTGKILGVALCVGILSTVYYAATNAPPPKRAPQEQQRTVLMSERSSPRLSEKVHTKEEQQTPEPKPSPAANPVAKRVISAKRRIERNGGSVETVEPSAPNPADELALLKSAQQALDQKPRITLELTERHQELYPNGIFGQEREMLAIEALTKLGEKELARQRGRRFSERYPDSAHIRRIDNLLERRK